MSDSILRINLGCYKGITNFIGSTRSHTRTDHYTMTPLEVQRPEQGKHCGTLDCPICGKPVAYEIWSSLYFEKIKLRWRIWVGIVALVIIGGILLVSQSDANIKEFLLISVFAIIFPGLIALAFLLQNFKAKEIAKVFYLTDKVSATSAISGMGDPHIIADPDTGEQIKNRRNKDYHQT